MDMPSFSVRKCIAWLKVATKGTRFSAMMLLVTHLSHPVFNDLSHKDYINMNGHRYSALFYSLSLCTG